MIKKIISIICIGSGIFLMISGIIPHLSFKKSEKELLDIIENNMSTQDTESTEEIIESTENITGENTSKETTVNNAENSTNKSTKKEDNYINNSIKAVGILEIPAIKLKSGIVEGATTKELKKGIGYYQNTPLPTESEGNMVIAAHNSGNMPVFRKLHKLNIGDEVKIKIDNKYYIYEVSDKFIVDPSDVEILESTPGVKEITMFTCTNKGKQRLVVKANFKE